MLPTWTNKNYFKKYDFQEKTQEGEWEIGLFKGMLWFLLEYILSL